MESRPVLWNLAGLSILRMDGEEAAAGVADLLWRHRRVARLDNKTAPDSPFVSAKGEESDEGRVTNLSFGYRGRTLCRFIVGEGGRSVSSWAVPEVSDRDLLALFGEHILRTVLVRRGLISFHAASLTNGEGAILIMGDKGMGKSTLSSALQQRGWIAIADDLTRVADTGAHWRAFPGLRDTKLLADSLAGLGLEREVLPARWDDENAAGGDKRLLAPLSEPPADPRAFRLSALLILQDRRADVGEIAHRLSSPLEAVRHLLNHTTRDPLQPTLVPPTVQRAIGSLVRSLPVIEVALPDRMDALHASAATIDGIVRRLDARQAA